MYVSDVGVELNAVNVDDGETDQFAAEPVALVETMRMAVERVLVMEGASNRMPREDTTARADHST